MTEGISEKYGLNCRYFFAFYVTGAWDRVNHALTSLDLHIQCCMIALVLRNLFIMSDLSDTSDEYLSAENSESDRSEDEGEVLSGAVRPYENEPVASSSESDGEEMDSGEDEDGIPPRTLVARSEGRLELEAW